MGLAADAADGLTLSMRAPTRKGLYPAVVYGYLDGGVSIEKVVSSESALPP